MTTIKTKPAADETPKAGLRARIGGAKEIATEVSGALAAGGKAYVGGMVELGRTLGGFGREIVTEAGEHVRATLQAKNLRMSGSCRPPLRSTASRCRRPMPRSSPTSPAPSPKR